MNNTAKPTNQVVQLTWPVAWDGSTVDRLTMRRPTVRDLLSVEGIPSEQRREVQLYAVLCSVNPECLEQLDLADYRQLQEVFSAFLPRTSSLGPMPPAGSARPA